MREKKLTLQGNAETKTLFKCKAKNKFNQRKRFQIRNHAVRIARNFLKCTV